MIGRLPIRKQDAHGSGEWGASRGTRKHNGIDLAAYPGTVIISPVQGTVTKLGYPYADDLTYKYVQVTTSAGEDHRFFYLNPMVDIGDPVWDGETELGYVQDLGKRYSGITSHAHYEIKVGGEYVEPKKPV